MANLRMSGLLLIVVLRRTARLLTMFLVCCLGTVAVSGYLRRELPPPEAMLTVLQNEPLQAATNEEQSTFNYAGIDYLVQPRADYSIYGLVVSHNNIEAIDDIYHNSSSVDVKDLCLIWGDNVQDDIYKRLHIWSEPWTCNFEARTREDYADFNKQQVSNNHLLPANDRVRQLIRSVETGDQVLISGKLIDYARADAPQYVRKTSLSRADTGNGACEVLLVTDISLLKRGSVWHLIYRKAVNALFILIMLKAIQALVFPYLEYRLR